jgi:hypothetical protein
VHDPTPWSRPRIAALVAATFADLYRRLPSAGSTGRASSGGLRALNGNSNDAALFDTLRTMLAGSRIRTSSCMPRWRARPATTSLAMGLRSTHRAARAETAAIREARQQQWSAPTGAACSTPCLQGKGHRAANDKLLWGAWATSAISTS